MDSIPPILHVGDLTEEIFTDIRDASQTYCQQYGYMAAFDELRTIPERRQLLAAILAGHIRGEEAVQKLRKWLLGPWRSARSLTTERLPEIGRGLTAAVEQLREIPSDMDLTQTTPSTIETMMVAFQRLNDCLGIGGTSASKILSALKPDLFMLWDRSIARAYKFDNGAAGYRKFLQLMVPATRRMRELWGQRSPSLEEYLKSEGREWLPPLTKFVDEWHWVRITRNHSNAGQ